MGKFLQHSKLTGCISSHRHPRSALDHLIQNHAFNNSVEIVVPSTSLVKDEEIRRAVEKNGRPFFYVVNMSLTEFLSPSISQLFQEQRQLVALTSLTRIDRTDAAAVTPDGVLHLALTKDTYERLSVQADHSKCTPKERFNLNVNLRSDDLRPGTKRHAKVMERWSGATAVMEFLCVSNSEDGLATIQFSPGVSSRCVEVEHQTMLTALLETPPLPPHPAREALGQEDLEALYEWLGVVSCSSALARVSLDDNSSSQPSDAAGTQAGH
ncbi:hypothetical protein CYMTET_28566 [Cymbomonas tetramitiformis]|uniref:Uncharacterized protein n=1 Tax=Cymbomonas tetramitiformis TaxID=36881 RepID=A0AAE0FMV3_9CHLO|nr:hypothetical protein CYMTET_28566 [Cymbomonas tetramitiformis]